MHPYLRLLRHQLAIGVVALAAVALVAAACGGGDDDNGDDGGQASPAVMDEDDGDDGGGTALTEEELEALEDLDFGDLDLGDLDLEDLDLEDLDLGDLDLGDLDFPEDTEENAALRERACELLTQADAEMLTGAASLPMEGAAMLGSGCLYGPAIDGTEIRVVSLDIPDAAGGEQEFGQSIDLANQAFVVNGSVVTWIKRTKTPCCTAEVAATLVRQSQDTLDCP